MTRHDIMVPESDEPVGSAEDGHAGFCQQCGYGDLIVIFPGAGHAQCSYCRQSSPLPPADQTDSQHR